MNPRLRPFVSTITESPMNTLLALACASVMLSGLVAQQPGLSEAERETLAGVFSEVRNAKGGVGSKAEKALEKARENQKAAWEKVRDAHKGEDILRHVDSWTDVFSRINARGKVQKPDGCGRARTARVDHSERGKEFGFEYTLYVPPLYDGRKSWPLIVALHDKGSNGEKYLNEVLLRNDKGIKELRDQFVILAPSIAERTVGRKAAEQLRIDWYGQVHYFGIAKCIGEAMRQCNIDTTRIYLEGCGEGGRAGLDIATLQPKIFAAVAVRNAGPKSQNHLVNLKNQAGVMFLSREDQLFASEDGKALRAQLDTIKTTSALDMDVKIYPALDASKARAAIGTQKVDPVAEATLDVLNFFVAHERKPFPETLAYVTDDLSRYRRAAWLVIDRGDADKETGLSVVVEAQIDRAANAVRIKSQNLQACRLYLNDRLLDLDKPVKVFVNGKEVLEAKVERSLDYMLGFSEDNPTDPSAVVVGELRVTVPGLEQPEAPKSGGDK
ncbi:MAG: hypothetical protein EXS14_00975 [Planctomycetes bacterium]|nr:hypothetical protein [Planctomycetota bacterium]